MRKRAVRLRHFVCIFAFLDRVALSGGRVLDLSAQRFCHRHALARIGIHYDPTRRQRNLACGTDFHRHLVGGATDAARFHFQSRTDILDRLVYDFERIDGIRSLARFLNGGVDNALGERFLAALHHRSDEPRHCRTPIAGIDALFLFVNSLPSRHCRSSVSKFTFSLPWPLPALLSPRRLRQPRHLSGASLRTWSGSGLPPLRLASPAHRAQCDSARPANLLLVPRARARWSAPAGCAPRLECRQSLPGRSSSGPGQLCEARNSASSECASSLARTRRDAGDNWPGPVTSTSPTPSGVLSESTD